MLPLAVQAAPADGTSVIESIEAGKTLSIRLDCIVVMPVQGFTVQCSQLTDVAKTTLELENMIKSKANAEAAAAQVEKEIPPPPPPAGAPVDSHAQPHKVVDTPS